MIWNRSRQRSQVFYLRHYHFFVQIDCSVIDRVLLGLLIDQIQCNLPHVIGMARLVVLHELRLRSYILHLACVFSHAPTTVTNISGSLSIIDSVILDFVGELAVVSVVLHSSLELIFIEQWSPVLKSCLNDEAIIRSCLGIGA